MEQSPFEAGQEIPCLLWKVKVHYHVHKWPLLDPVLSKLNAVNTLTHKQT